MPEGEALKGTRGTVVVVGGALETPGAVLLAGIAALRAGAGVLQVATVRSAVPALAVALPEARVVPLDEGANGVVGAGAAGQVGELVEGCQAAVIGPGLAGFEDIGRLVEAAVLATRKDGALVVDALGLSGLTPELARRCRGHLVMTPNFKEMGHLLDIPPEKVTKDPAGAVRRAADEFRATVALRGGQSWITEPKRRVHLDDSGIPGLGTSGSGDVLAGFLCGLLARGTPALPSALWAVHVHAQAGRRLTARLGPVGFLARELLDELSLVAVALSS
ncbi:MAG: NAD(P)H-hydrate dehydratase [Candidatus Dormibacteria bacterium]